MQFSGGRQEKVASVQGAQALPKKGKPRRAEAGAHQGFVFCVRTQRSARTPRARNYSSSLVMIGARLPLTSPLPSIVPLRTKVATFLLQSRSPVADATNVAAEVTPLLE